MSSRRKHCENCTRLLESDGSCRAGCGPRDADGNNLDDEDRERISFPKLFSQEKLLELQGFPVPVPIEPDENRSAIRAWAKLLRSVPNVHESLGRDPEHQQELALAEHLAAYSNPPAPGTVEAIREMLKTQRAEKCCDACPGWIIDRSLLIATCDECVRGNDLPLYDQDVERLPEAQLKLAEEIAEYVRSNHLEAINHRLPPRKRLEVMFHGFEDLKITTRSGEVIFEGPAVAASMVIESITALMMLVEED